MKNNISITITCLLVGGTLAIAPLANAQNVLGNPGFDSAFGSNPNGNWVSFGNAFQQPNPGGPASNDGTGKLKMFGNFAGAFNVSGVFQDFSASVGQVFNASAVGQNWSGDAMQTGNSALMKVIFQDSAGHEITSASKTSASIDLNTPADQWVPLSISNIVAPTGTVNGQVLFLFLQDATNHGGSAWFDSASVTAQAVPEPKALAVLGLGVVALLIRRRVS